MIKITNQQLISLCGVKNDIFFEPRSKFLYQIKYYEPIQGQPGTFYYTPIMKYSYNKTFALCHTMKK
jgi:hypothetical protein